MSGAIRQPSILLVGEAGSPLSALEAALRTTFVEARFLTEPRRVVADAAAQATDLVVVDATVQSVSWWAALAALQREPQTCSVPVAIYSAAPEFDFVPPIILGACGVLEGDAASVSNRLFILLGEVTVRPPTAGGEQGADAARQLHPESRRVS